LGSGTRKVAKEDFATRGIFEKVSAAAELFMEIIRADLRHRSPSKEISGLAGDGAKSGETIFRANYFWESGFAGGTATGCVSRNRFTSPPSVIAKITATRSVIS
jgi:hypothetical protein